MASDEPIAIEPRSRAFLPLLVESAESHDPEDELESAIVDEQQRRVRHRI